MTYQPPVRDFVFLMKDVLKLEQYSNLKGFSEASMDVLEQIIEEAGKFSAEVLAPLNAVGDKEGCTWHPDHSVTTPRGSRKPMPSWWPAAGPVWGPRSPMVARACPIP